MRSWYLNVTDRQTDRRLTVAQPRSALASRGKNHWPTFLPLIVWLHSNSSGGLLKTHLICKSAYRPFKVIQHHWLWY